MKEKNREKKYPAVSVGGLMVNRNGKIFLAKGTRWGDKFTIIGGKVELGESLTSALEREMKEEAGIRVKIIRELSCGESIHHNDDKSNKHAIFIDYLCFYDGGDDDMKTNEEFTDEFIWIEPAEALKLDLAPDVDNVIKKYLEYKESENCSEKWKRAVADFENYKKRQAVEMKQMLEFGSARLISEIIPVLDNFHASTGHIPEGQKDSPWVTGIMHIQRQLETVLTENGVAEIKIKAGDKFEPSIMEAIENKDCPPEKCKNVVKKIVTKGYKIGERVVRAARVIVE